MVHIGLDYLVFIVMAVVLFLYSRWLLATDYRRYTGKRKQHRF
jgi:hypothetical protein